VPLKALGAVDEGRAISERYEIAAAPGQGESLSGQSKVDDCLTGNAISEILPDWRTRDWQNPFTGRSWGGNSG